MKRFCSALLVAAALLTQSPRVQATTGSVEIKLDAGELPVTNGTVTIYHVGTRTAQGYQITDRYGGGIIGETEVESGYLAGWLAEMADGGRSLLLDVDGRAVFSNLDQGLYLVAQTDRMDGFYPFRPFLVAVPSGSTWKIRKTPAILPISPEPPQTGQDPQLLWAVWGMTLSGTGLVLCWGTYEKKKRSVKKVL